jgi:TRAP-type C4-dicarboxylate transport system permease small subunit
VSRNGAEGGERRIAASWGGGAAFDRALDALLAIIVALTALATLLQVFRRYVLNAPLSWPEEFAVLMFGWMILLGAALVQRRDGHISIDLLRRRVGARAARRLDAIRWLVIGFASVVLIWQGIGLAERTVALKYPAMGISRAFLYGAVPVCFGLLLINLVRSILAPVEKSPDPDHGA